MDKNGIEIKEADLHMHSNYSDGRNTIEELFSLVKKANLKAAVLTDHDRVEGLYEFIFYCKNNGIDSVSGVEISSTDTTSHPQTIDVLGYGFNPGALLRDYNHLLEHNLNVRIKYIKEVLDMYAKRWEMNFTLDSLRTHFKLPREVANKYWIIAARMENLSNSTENFKALEKARKELKRGGDYFVERENYVSTKEAIDAIKQSGGVAIWAHPTKTIEKLEKKYENSKNIFSTIIDRMAHEGLDGIELYTSYGDSYKKILLNCAGKYNLIMTGGSDYHGEYGLAKDCHIGSKGITYKEFLQIKKAIHF